MFHFTVPSIVVHKGGITESRAESPCTVVCKSGMPSLPASRQQGFTVGSPGSSKSDMIEANVAEQLHSSASVSASSSIGPNDSDAKNYRNRVSYFSLTNSAFHCSLASRETLE